MSENPFPDTDAAIDFGEAAVWFRQKAEAHTDGYRRLAGVLTEPGDRLAADVGCGAAGMALALAERLPEARVVAVDAEPEMVAVARERADEAGLAVETAVVDLDQDGRLSEVLGGPADLIWAGHVVHHAADQQAVLDGLAGLLAPGGRLALGEGGIRPQFLPRDLGVGRPGLELRLAEAASRRLEAENRAHRAKPLPYGWNVALEHAGLTGVREYNEAVAIPAPLEGPELEHAIDALRRWADWNRDYLDAEDQAAWESLLDSDSPYWLGDRRDLHHLEVRATYVGDRRLFVGIERAGLVLELEEPVEGGQPQGVIELIGAGEVAEQVETVGDA